MATPTPDRTAAQSLMISAAAANPQTPVTIWVRAGNDMGLTEIGQIYYPGQLPDMLHALADSITADAAAQT
jgi:hypothetical protein